MIRASNGWRSDFAAAGHTSTTTCLHTFMKRCSMRLQKALIFRDVFETVTGRGVFGRADSVSRGLHGRAKANQTGFAGNQVADRRIHLTLARSHVSRDRMNSIRDGMNLGFGAINSIASGMNLVWRTMNSIADGMNLGLRTINSIADGMNLVRRTMNSIRGPIAEPVQSSIAGAVSSRSTARST